MELKTIRKVREPIPLAEFTLLLLMLLTLMIPSAAISVAPWNGTPIFLLARGILWLLGMVLLPGLYLLRLTKIGQTLPTEGRIALAINLSFVIVGMVALLFYYFNLSYALLPWVVLIILLALRFIYSSRNAQFSWSDARKISRWKTLLIISIIASISISFTIQIAQRYQIAGDVWVSLNPAVEILSQRNVYQAFSSWEYPVFFGFILAGLSACSGLPVLNTYVLLFPLVGLNVLSFFVMLKIVFDQEDRIASIASVLYSFGGGLALLFQLLVYHGQTSFWDASFSTFDGYFGTGFWNGILFFYKSLALTLVYMSLTVFVAAARIKELKSRIVGLFFASLMAWACFLIHMLELAIFVPIVLGIAFIYQSKKERFNNLAYFSFITLLVALSLDTLMSGYYYWLTSKKASSFLTTVNVTTLPLMFVGIISIAVVVVIAQRFAFRPRGAISSQRKWSNWPKSLAIFCIAIVYVSGLFFWTPANTGVSYPFPWYLYVTRYGFLGLLAFVGVKTISWRKHWFALAALWSIIAVLAGSVWWGVRLNGFLFPMAALLGAIGLQALWTTRESSLKFFFAKREPSSGNRIFTIRLKPLMAALMIATLVFSFSSFLYGTAFYVGNGPSLDDDAAKAIGWIQQNVPENVTVLVPNIYSISKGVETIGDRHVFNEAQLPTVFGSVAFTNITGTFYAHNIEYAVTIGNDTRLQDPVQCLLSYSELVFQSGEVRIFKFPKMKPPSSEYTVAVIDKQPLGLSDNTADFGWFDDSFSQNWTNQNANASSDGEILTFSWSFNSYTVSEPTIKRNIPPSDTNKYPFLIVRYKNTLRTTPTAENNIGQIITVVNETGYPKGYVKNFYLPISKGNTFNTYVSELPKNQNITSITLWMRNYQKLNGSVELQIDYLGFASNENITATESLTSFLSMALPSIWPMNYSIVSEFNETGGALVVVSTYDKSVPTYLQESQSANSYVFLNATARSPTWGTEWQEITGGIMLGNYENKRVIIVGLNANLNISELTNAVYQTLIEYS